MGPLLAIDELTVAFPVNSGWVPVVRQARLRIEPGEFVGLVGESGSGKSLTALTVLRLLPPRARVLNGSIRLHGVELLSLPESEMRRVRGGKIGMIFQEPMTALNPVFTVGFQIAEAVKVHRQMSRSRARAEAARLLNLVALPDAERRLDDYPHQLSGGQRQRVMIAIALAASPELVIADEPSTALDVTVQAQILDLLEGLRRELGLAILLITHDLAVVAETCSRVTVMYAGQVVEEAGAGELFSSPAHPYSRGLLKAVPTLGRRSEDGRLPTIPGQIPDPGRLPTGCAFHPRCPEVMDRCRHSDPPAYTVDKSHLARCFLHDTATSDEEISR